MENIQEIRKREKLIDEQVKEIQAREKKEKRKINTYTTLSKIEVQYKIKGNLEKWEEADGIAINLINRIDKHTLMAMKKADKFEVVYEMLRNAYFYLGSRGKFHYYMIGLELNRPRNERFYEPRMKQLKVAVEALQQLFDREITKLIINMPPRVGKTTLGLYFISMCLGINPNKSTLGITYSSSIAKTFYQGLEQILNDDATYNFNKIFPNSPLVEQNSKDMTIDLNKASRYKSLTLRSIDGSITGAVEANDILYLDDLVSGIEEAKNVDRLRKLWDKVSTDVYQRRKPMQGCVTLVIGTIWSIDDPIQKIIDEQELLTDGSKMVNIVMPALNENDDSNFEYEYGVGFDSKYYINLRDVTFVDDPTTFSCVYQQLALERIERTFTDLKEYTEYRGKLKRVVATIDLAFGGGDCLSMPVCYVTDEGEYIEDFYLSTATHDITEPEVVKMILKHNINYLVIEGNNGGEFYVENIIKRLKKFKNVKCVVKMAKASTKISKYARIEQYQPDIMKLYYKCNDALAPYCSYRQAKAHLKAFSLKGNAKRQKDDVPDSLALLCSALRVNKRRRSISGVDRNTIGGML